MTAAVLRRLLIVFVALGSGCVVQIAHTPNTGLVHQMGYEQAASQLAAVIARARRPVVAEVNVQPQSVTLTTHGAVWGWWGVHASPIREIFFANLLRTEIFGNARTFVYDVNNHRMAQFDFATVEDGRLFTDLMMSFRAWDAGEAPPPAEPEPAYEQPAEEPYAPRDETYEPLNEGGDDYPADEYPADEDGTTTNVLEGE